MMAAQDLLCYRCLGCGENHSHGATQDVSEQPRTCIRTYLRNLNARRLRQLSARFSETCSLVVPRKEQEAEIRIRRAPVPTSNLKKKGHLIDTVSADHDINAYLQLLRRDGKVPRNRSPSPPSAFYSDAAASR